MYKQLYELLRIRESSAVVYSHRMCVRIRLDDKCPRERLPLAAFLALHFAIGRTGKPGNGLSRLFFLTAFGLIPPLVLGLVNNDPCSAV